MWRVSNSEPWGFTRPSTMPSGKVENYARAILSRPFIDREHRGRLYAGSPSEASLGPPSTAGSIAQMKGSLPRQRSEAGLICTPDFNQGLAVSKTDRRH